MHTVTGIAAGQDSRPWLGLDDTASAVLAMLSEHVGLDVWMLTHLDGQRQTAISVYPRGQVRAGMSLPWSSTFCSRMVAGEGPQVASVVSAVPAYAELRADLTRLGLGPLGMPGAYIGVPIRRRDDTLYGTLCGFAARAQPPALRRHLRLVQFGAQVLATALDSDAALENNAGLDIDAVLDIDDKSGR